MDIKYEDRLVAFVDILGFTQLIKKSVNDQNVFNRIYNAIKFIYKTKEEANKFYIPDFDNRVTVFSDSIVISLKVTEGSLIWLFEYLIYLQQNLVMQGLLLRGGISIGELVHTEKIILGPAYIEAYKLEEESAIYPRIILNPKIVNDILRQIKTEFDRVIVLSCLEKDNNDDYYNLNYLKQVDELNLEDAENLYNNLIRKTKEVIENGLLSIDLNIRNKYLWLKNDFNKNLKSHGNKYDDLLIK